MPNLVFQLISNDDGANITVFHEGRVLSATSTHPNWEAIRTGALNDDASIVTLFDLGETAALRFAKLSERVAVKNGNILFDGRAVDNTLTNQVVRFIENGQEDFGPLVEFFEKIETNENEHSREQLFDWLRANEFTILPDGDFIGYKGVRSVVTTDGVKYESINHGNAISNGVEYTGAIPNPIGAVVEMPRDEVQHDPSVGCHTGLHVGTWDYASGFARGAILKVRVNPRDVVSVPTDCGHQKLRTCRYTVLEVINAPIAGPLDYDYVEDDEDDEPAAVVGYNFDNPQSVVQTMAGRIDTRQNHLRQKRDANGRFIKKSK